MKKISLIVMLLFITILIIPVSGQSLKLTFNSDTVKDDSVYTYICSISKLNIDSIGVTNISGKTVSVKVKKIIIDTLPGTLNTFCWGVNCFEPTVYISPKPIAIYSNTSNKSFYGEYNPMGKVGSSTIRYVFFDNNNINDSSCVTVKYILKSAGIENFSNQQSGNGLSNVYPNPFKQQTTVNYELSENSFVNIKIYELTGKEMATLVNGYMNKGKHNNILNASELKEGFYYCSMTTNNKSITFRKIAILH